MEVCIWLMGVEYEQCLRVFAVVCSDHIFIEYVKNTWLNNHIENFDVAWTYWVIHLENTTTNWYAQCNMQICIDENIF